MATKYIHKKQFKYVNNALAGNAYYINFFKGEYKC